MIFGNDPVDYHIAQPTYFMGEQLMPRALSHTDLIVSNADVPNFVSHLDSQDINMKNLKGFLTPITNNSYALVNTPHRFQPISFSRLCSRLPEGNLFWFHSFVDSFSYLKKITFWILKPCYSLSLNLRFDSKSFSSSPQHKLNT